MSGTFKTISVCLNVCQNDVFRFLKEHWICLKFTQTKISFHSTQWLRIHEPDQRKTFIPFPIKIVEFSKINPGSLSQTFWNTSLILLGRVLDNDHRNSKLNKIIYFLRKNAAMNFWFTINVGSNICITIITFAYESSWKTFAKEKIFVCIIIWLHLHVHAGANPCITSIKNSHMHLLRKHLHHKKFSVVPSYGYIHVCIVDKNFLH